MMHRKQDNDRERQEAERYLGEELKTHRSKTQWRGYQPQN